MSKKLKSHNATEWYMHKPELFYENGRYKILLDFKKQTDQPIPVRRPNLINNFKKIALLADHRMKVNDS